MWKQIILLHYKWEEGKNLIKHLKTWEFQKDLYLHKDDKVSDFIKVMKEKYWLLRWGYIYPYLRFLKQEPVFIDSVIQVWVNGKLNLYYYDYKESKFEKITKNDNVYLPYYSSMVNFWVFRFLNKLWYNFHYISNTTNLDLLPIKSHNFLLQETWYNDFILEWISMMYWWVWWKVEYSQHTLNNLWKFLENNKLRWDIDDVVLKVSWTALWKWIYFFNLSKKEDIKEIIKILGESDKSFIIAKNVKQSDYEIRAYITTNHINQLKIHWYSLKQKREDMKTHHSWWIKNFRNFERFNELVDYVYEQSGIKIQKTERELKKFLQYLVNINSIRHWASDIAITGEWELKYYENNIVFMPLIDEEGNEIFENWCEVFLSDLK